MNEEAIARVGLQRHKKEKKVYYLWQVIYNYYYLRVDPIGFCIILYLTQHVRLQDKQ